VGLFGRRKPLSSLRRPERAVATCAVTSPNDRTSPLTGIRAAAFHVALFERYHVDRGNRSDHGVEHLEPLGAVIFGQTLQLVSDDEGLVIEVPLEGARLSFRSADRDAQLLERAPAELAALAARAQGHGLVCFRESAIGQGDRFRLRATREPQSGAGPGDYRKAARAALVARPDLGPVELEEILDLPRW
jgi:hypothetical protein